LGRQNNPVPPSGHYDWLVHLDRRLISPMELLQASAWAPPQLTHRFVGPEPPPGALRPFGHLAPWFDASTRLYRVFELLEPRDPTPGAEIGGRVCGKINLNTVWDVETLRALCDPQPGNAFTRSDVDSLFARLLALRTPAGTPGAGDRPFLGLGVGHSPAP